MMRIGLVGAGFVTRHHLIAWRGQHGTPNWIWRDALSKWPPSNVSACHSRGANHIVAANPSALITTVHAIRGSFPLAPS